jgi:high-affinity nickel permease
MVTAVLALGTALVIGFVHALEVDHMVAVTAFVSRRPTVPAAVAFSLRWGLGHSLAVFLAGAILLATGVRWAPGLANLLEGAVGVALVTVGIWSLRTTHNLHPNQSPEHGPARRGITAVGLLHGLAGTSAVVALIPVTLLPARTLGMAYLALFGVGVTAGMIVFALAAAMTMRRAAGASLLWGRRVASVAGFGSITLGCWWLGRALLAA